MIAQKTVGASRRGRPFVPTKKSMCRTFAIAICLAFTLLISHHSTSAQNDKFLSRLHGNWQGEGKAFGMPARVLLK